MYTVNEFIEALKKCPADYKVSISGLALVEAIGIDNEYGFVDLFAENEGGDLS